MSEQKKKIVLAAVLASLLVILLGWVSIAFFPAQQASQSPTSSSAPIITGPYTGPMTIEIPVSSTVELDSSKGFTVSLPAAVPNSMPFIPPGLNITSSAVPESEQASPLLVLAPGGTGSVPFLVYSSSSNETVNVSLSVQFWSSPVANESVSFSVSPSNFNIRPGEKVTSLLTITANENTPTAFYQPFVDVQTNSSDILGTQINMPDLLVSNATPSCLFLVNENETFLMGMLPVAPGSAPAQPMGNASAGIQPSILLPPLSSSTPAPNLLFVPTINLAPRETATVMYACLTQYNLSLNVTAPAGFSYEFSPNPLNIIFSNTTGKIYSLTVTVASSISSEEYEVNATGTMGSSQFNASFFVAVT